MAEFDIEQQVNNAIAGIDNYNHLLGRTLLQPFKPADSGSRALMSSIHAEHFLVLNNPEVPTIGTGYENEFGEWSSSFVRAQSDYQVLFKFDKYSFKPGVHYYLVVRDLRTGEYDVFERKSYYHSTEGYGYRWNNKIMDNMKINDNITAGQIIKTSIGFDEYGNKMNGVNLLTCYVSSAQNMEDSCIISESCAKKLASTLVKTRDDIIINNNDVLLDLYGDGENYKSFPDIGEYIKDGEFCVIRRAENDTILYTKSRQRLREPLISDRHILFDGIVADIDVYCNDPAGLAESYYNRQLYFYYQEKVRFAKEVNDALAPIAMTGQMTRRLNRLYSTCRDITNGVGFYKNGPFNNVNMEVTVMELLPAGPGDKISDRHGGKGVISMVLPDNMMGMLDNGRYIDLYKNQSTCMGRENIGQLHELSLSFIGLRILDCFEESRGIWTPREMVEIWLEFLNFVDPRLAAEAAEEVVNLDNEYLCNAFIESLFTDGRILLSDEPYTTKINMDTLAELYDMFPFVKPYKVTVPIKDSNGNVRYVQTRRDLVVGEIYHYRLKQFAEEKFSVTSLPAMNLKGLNTRSKANKMYEAKYTKTPIMFGPMESGDMGHMGMQWVVMNLMLYSSSPQARKLFENLLIGDPYKIDIKLDKESKNRNAEVINALMETMGLELIFRKIPKKKLIMCGIEMCKVVPNQEFKYKTNIRDIIGHDDELQMRYNAAIYNSTSKKKMCGIVMCKVGERNDTNNK